MRMRTGFVTNSSTTNFVLVNITRERLSLKDFFLENMDLIKGYMEDRKADGEAYEDFENLDTWLRNEGIEAYGILLYDLSEAYDVTEVVLKNMELGEGRSDRFIWMRKRE